MTEQEAPDLYRIVRELSQTNQMPMPKIHISEMAQPGVRERTQPRARWKSVTRGILEILDERDSAASWRTSSPMSPTATS